MATTGDLELTILDGGAGTVVVPASSVAVVIGACSSGTVNQIVATRNANTLAGLVGYGPAVVQAAMIIAAGGTVLFMKSTTTTPGAVANGSAAKTVTGVSLAAVITATGHGFTTGDVVTVAGVVGAVEVNVTKKITVLTANTFTFDGITVATAYVSGGTATASGVRQLATGTSILSITGTPYDSYIAKLVWTVGGTIGTSARFKLSLDAGRTYGPEISLGTATTYAVANTGMTLNFAAGTVVAGDTATFTTTEPLTSDASISSALTALEASPYSSTGWGTLRIVGPRVGASASLIQGYLDTLVATKTWTRAIIEVRDNAMPTDWGGLGETDAAWAAAVALDYSAVSAKRICAVAGNYNMDSKFAIPAAGTPIMRRNGAYALACRQVGIQPQNHAGRVKDGAIAQIIVDPTKDPVDGFNYHDDYNAPALDVARFTSFRKRKGRPGYFVVNPNLMSPGGSVFTLLPLGVVMDIASSLLYQTGENEINSDVRLNDNGTIDEIAAQDIEKVNLAVLRDNMYAKNMISNFAYVIDRTNNVRTTSTVNFAATIYSRGYILQINGTVGFGTSV